MYNTKSELQGNLGTFRFILHKNNVPFYWVMLSNEGACVGGIYEENICTFLSALLWT